MSATTPSADASLQKPEWAQSKFEKANAERIAQGLPPKKRRRWPWLVLLVVIIAAVVFLVAGRQQAPTTQDEAAEAPVVMQVNAMEVTTLELRTLEQTVKVTGSLAPQSKAEVASQVSGKIESVAVRAGQAVEAGDTLAQVDVVDLQVTLDQQLANRAATQAQLDLARTQLNTTTALSERGLTPQSTLEERQSNVAALQSQVAALDAQVRTAERALQNATIRSPIAGIVASRTVDPGQTVSPGTALFSIVDLSVIEVQATAPLSAATQIKPDQRVNVTVESIRNQTFTAEVERVNPVGIEGTRSIPVYLTLDNPDGLFRGGMFATGQVVVEEAADAIALPPAAIREDAQGEYVLKIADGKAVRQSVEKGGTWANGSLVQITSGLAAGDVVVTAALEELQADTAVEIVGN